MKTIDDVGVTFVNALLARGVFNNNVNLTFGTALFTPSETKIDTDIVISTRLRMDIPCARGLYDALGALLASIDNPGVVHPNDPLQSVPLEGDKPN